MEPFRLFVVIADFTNPIFFHYFTNSFVVFDYSYSDWLEKLNLLRLVWQYLVALMGVYYFDFRLDIYRFNFYHSH